MDFKFLSDKLVVAAIERSLESPTKSDQTAANETQPPTLHIEVSFKDSQSVNKVPVCFTLGCRQETRLSACFGFADVGSADVWNFLIVSQPRSEPFVHCYVYGARESGCCKCNFSDIKTFCRSEYFLLMKSQVYIRRLKHDR